MRPLLAAALAAGLLVGPAAHAENAMGYRLLSPQAAAELQPRHGSLGMDIERAREISDSGMTFDLIRVKQVRRGSAGAAAGFQPGDQIIAIDGWVFPSLSGFATYVGSLPPGTRAAVDVIPAGGGAAQAQRVAVVIGGPGAGSPTSAQPPAPALSTNEKLAIGAGVALLGCYELGCFSHNQAQPPPPSRPQPVTGAMPSMIQR